jgi:hypothetical protein
MATDGELPRVNYHWRLPLVIVASYQELANSLEWYWSLANFRPARFSPLVQV